MRLIVVIGYPEERISSTPFPVYVGRSSVEADAAIEASEGVVFEIIRNPTTVRKRRKTPLPFSEPQPETPVVDEAAAAAAEAAAKAEADAAAAAAAITPVVEDNAAPAPPADVAPSGGVSGKRGRAA